MLRLNLLRTALFLASADHVIPRTIAKYQVRAIMFVVVVVVVVIFSSY